MSQSKFEWKVGIFVLIGLVLLAGLMINFSRGLPFFKSTYELKLRAQNVGGIKTQAAVMLSGVKIGDVKGVVLAPDGTVFIRLRIYEEFKIDRGTRFMLDSMGFLGDQYVAIIPDKQTETYLADGDEVVAESPLNLQEAMRSTAGLLNQAQATMKTLDEAVSNVNRTVLNEATLTSFSRAIGNLQTISSNANETLDKIDVLIVSNSPAISASFSNLHDFSADLKLMLSANQKDISSAVQNLRIATETVNELLSDVQATNGPLGTLLRDEQMALHMQQLVLNANAVAESWAAFGSNLNTRGIWSMLWRQKQPRSERDR